MPADGEVVEADECGVEPGSTVYLGMRAKAHCASVDVEVAACVCRACLVRRVCGGALALLGSVLVALLGSVSPPRPLGVVRT